MWNLLYIFIMRLCYLVVDMCACESACYTPTHHSLMCLHSYQYRHVTARVLREETLNTSMPDTYQYNTHDSHTHPLAQHQVITELAVGFLSLPLNSRPLNEVWILRPENPGHILYNPFSKNAMFVWWNSTQRLVSNKWRAESRWGHLFFSNRKHPCWRLNDSISHMWREGHCAHRSLVLEGFLEQGQGYRQLGGACIPNRSGHKQAGVSTHRQTGMLQYTTHTPMNWSCCNHLLITGLKSWPPS